MNCDHRAPAYMLVDEGKKNREEFAKTIKQAEEFVRQAIEAPLDAARTVGLLCATGLCNPNDAAAFMEIIEELSVANEQIRVRLQTLSARVCSHC